MPVKSPRPPSPGGQSVASAASKASTVLKPTISAQKKQQQREIGGASPDSKSKLSASVLAAIPQGPSAVEFMTVEACLEYVSAPHHTWDSASREMARMATKAQLTQAALEARGGGKGGGPCDETASVRSGMSSVSAFSFAKSNASTSRKGLSRGHMAMLPLGGQNGNTITSPKEVPDLVLSGTSTSVAGGHGTFSFITQPSSRAGVRSGGANGAQRGYEGEDEGDTKSETSMRRVGSIVGAAGGLSGVRNARGPSGGPSSAPTLGKNKMDDSSSVASSRSRVPLGGKKVPPAPVTRKQPAPPAPTHDLSDLIKVGSVRAK